MLVIVPLGENGKYRAKANNFDQSHVTCMPEKRWEMLFHECGWEVESFEHTVRGIKDSYYQHNPDAHGFWKLSNERILL